MAESDNKSIPLKLKVRAWWEGYDQDDVRRVFLDGQESDEEAAKPKPKPPAIEVSDDPDLPFEPWDKHRIEIAQCVWGDGFCGPGGPEHIIAMSKLLALSPEQSLLDLGCGLGGPGRTLAEEFGVWVSGYQVSEKLVEAGNQLSKMAGMTKKCSIFHYDPENLEEFDRSFDRAVAKEALFLIENKKPVLSKIFEYLKPEGLLLITDYCLVDESAAGRTDVSEWKDSEPHRPRPCTADELGELLEATGFIVRVKEDITEQHQSIIASAWKEADKVAAKLVEQPESAALTETLVREAEFWARRCRLMDEGVLQVWRLLGYRKAGKGSLMSDW